MLFHQGKERLTYVNKADNNIYIVIDTFHIVILCNNTFLSYNYTMSLIYIYWPEYMWVIPGYW